MTKKMLAILIAGIMVFSMPGWAMAQGAGDMIQDQDRIQDQTQDPLQTQDQIMIQQRDRDQTNINSADQEQARLQLRDRLHILDQAKTQLQERLQTQDQTRLCFPDIEGHWAMAQIRSAYQWGLINGYPDGSFGPNQNVTGAEGIVMMSRLMERLSGIDPGTVAAGQVDWESVPLWARERLQEAVALRIAVQSQFYGESRLNRLQFAVMLAKALGIEPTTVPEGTVDFLDQDELTASELGYIHALRTLGLIVGNQGYFYPAQAVTRAEAASMLTRVLDMLE
jgi:hypothetical protein